MATITVDIKALTGSFATDIKRVERDSKGVFANIEKEATRVGKAIGAGLAVAVTALAAMTKRAINTADEMGKAAQRIGIATPELSKLSYAAKLADVDLAQLSTGIVQLTKRMSENKEVFGAIGVQVTDSSGKLRKANEVFADVAEVFKGMEDGAMKTRLAIDLFGKSGTKLIPLLNEGKEGLKGMGDEAERLGIVIDDKTAKAAEAFNDDLTRLGVAFDGIFVKVAQDVLPVLNELVQKFQDPQFREGLAAIATGAATAIIEVVKLIAELGNLSRFAGEAIAARVNGPGANDIVRLEDAVARQRAVIAQLDQEGTGAERRNTSGYADEQRRELLKLTAQLNAAREAAEALAFQQFKLDEASRKATGGAKEQTEAEKAAIKTKEEAEAALKAYFDRLATGTTVTKELAKAEKERMKALREAMADWQRMDDQYSRELMQQEEELLSVARARDELAQHFDDQAEDIETEIRLLGLSGEAREREIILLEAERLARDETGQVVEEQRRRYEALLTTLAESQKMERAAAELAAVWADFTDGIEETLTDAIVDGGEAGVEALKRAFKDLQRDMTRGFIDSITRAFKDGGVQGVISGFSNNFGRGTGFMNSAAQGGGANWGNIGQTAAGAYGVYDNYRNGPGGSQGFWSGAASGAQTGSAFGTWGAIIGAIIGGIAGWIGGGKPTIRVDDSQNDATSRSRLDDVIGVARDRMEPGTATAFANAIQQFDNSIAGILDTYTGGADQLDRVRQALANYSIRVEGDAATIENVLSERFGEILSTFTADVQAFVNAGFTLEERVARLAEVVVRADQITSILDAFRVGDMLADMTESERALYALNQQYDAAVDALEDLEASQEDIAQIEEYRARAIARLTQVQAAAIVVTDEAARAYAEFVSEFTGGGGSQFQRALGDVQRELAETVDRANELARAAGLQAAREEDLIGARQRANDQIADLIAGLTETVIQQIAELYGTSAEALERQLENIDAQIAAIDRSDSSFGMIQALQREAQLGAERLRLQDEIAAALEQEETIRRRMGALDLAQNLADLGLARGVRFEDLASELGLNLDRFGEDLGITASAVGDFIRALEADSLTADVFGQGVQQIVDAIMAATAITDPKPVYIDDTLDPANRGGKARFNEIGVEPGETTREELIALREAFDRQTEVVATLLAQGNANTGRAAAGMEQVARTAQQERLNRESTNRRSDRLPVERIKAGR